MENLISTIFSNNSLSYIFITSLVLLAMFIVVLIRVRRIARNAGFVPKPKRSIRYIHIFFIFLVSAALVAYFIMISFEQGLFAADYLFLVVAPYLALLIFLVGSIYRYRNREFQVSSLSSQFLESKKLFWGSQLFHWGLMGLFFGHLIAFVFPASVIAWNSMPVRLLILEITGFVFGLSALVGLILLIVRRLSSSRLQVVANKADLFVYVILLVQFVSGLGVAFFGRWGSSWFASVLTPYLKSIFVFSPDVTAVSTMPWFVKIHIIGAFVMIAVIPFTRFMHFLVAPLDYTWRRYQVVIWNWNRRLIRNNIMKQVGHRSENH